jgi:circadian clock protein KaiC
MTEININAPAILEKCATGIIGFDEISGGGLPLGRVCLLSGYAGTGKSLFGIEFIVHGIEQFNEHGVFISFEESPHELATNVASLGFNLLEHQEQGRLKVIQIELPTMMVETGEYDLKALFIRLNFAVQSVGAKRVVLDGIENLFSAFNDLSILRTEFRRLVTWLKEQNLTSIITTERGRYELSRHGLEEYIADCVIALDLRIERQLATRRIRIVKYRGGSHGGDEYPFVLDKTGFIVMPITSAGLCHDVSSEKITSGIAGLDDLLAGGYYKGSSILVSGTSGTGKSSISAHMANASCQNGQRTLYVAMEESPQQIERNMRSIGLNLTQWREKDLLHFHAVRPTANGLEKHLASITSIVAQFSPQVVIIDPISAFDIGVTEETVKLMLIRIVDLFKNNGVTVIFTSLTSGGDAEEKTSVELSSLVDVWLLLRNFEYGGERNRALYVCKARGVAHSNQVREFILTNSGIKLENVILDENGSILTGSARILRERKVLADDKIQKQDIERRTETIRKKREMLEAQIAIMRAEFADAELALEAEIERENLRIQAISESIKELESNRNFAQMDKPI